MMIDNPPDLRHNLSNIRCLTDRYGFSHKGSKFVNIVLWIVQGLLALAFLMAGLMKATQPKEKLAERMGWVRDFSGGAIKLIGALEVLGAFGLLLPMLTGILPWLTPLAAVGLALTMIGAAFTHLRRKEYPGAVINVVLLALSMFAAYGRWGLFA